jgi:DNA-binding MarR family transcriptional regulator
MQNDAPDNRPRWVAELVLAELHALGAGATAVNLAGRCFLPSAQVTEALLELERAGLVTRRGHRWEARERRSGRTGPPRRIERRAERRHGLGQAARHR